MITDPQQLVNEFKHRFEADIRPSPRVWRRARPLRVEDYHRTAMQAYAETYETKMVEIAMPEDRFRHLIEMERWLNKMEHEYQGARQFVEREQRAAWVRQKDQRVQKAWDRYQTLLKLVERDYD